MQLAAAIAVFVAGLLSHASDSEAQRADRRARLSFAADRVEVHEDGTIEASRVTAHTAGLLLKAFVLRLSPTNDVVLDNIVVNANPPLVVRGRRAIIVTSPMRIVLEHPELVYGRRNLRSEAGSLDEHGTLRLSNATFVLCPQDPESCVIHSESVLLHPGGDLDLRRPSLRLSGREVLIFPLLRIRPPGKPGFLPPYLAYDPHSGLVVGPSGLLPLGEGVFASGYIAAATQGGPHFATEFVSTAGRLGLRGLSDEQGPHLALRGASHSTAGVWHLATSVDVPWDGRASARLALPLDQARNFHRTAALVSAPEDHALFETLGLMQLAHEPSRSLSTTSSTSLWLWPRSDRAPWLCPRVGVSLAAISLEGMNQKAKLATGLIEAGIDVAHNLGPVAIDIDLATIAALDLSSNTKPHQDYAASAVSARARLPLIASFSRGLSHKISPFVSGSTRLSSAAFNSTRAPRANLPRLFSATTVGLDSLLRWRHRDLTRLVIGQRWTQDTGGASLDLLRATASLGPATLQPQFSLVFDESLRRLAFFEAGIASKTELVSLSSTVSYYSARSAEILFSPLDDLPESLLLRPVDFPESNEITVARQEASLALGPYLSLQGMVYETLWPSPGLELVGYSIKMAPRCHCFEARLDGWHRLGKALPELMATVSLPAL